MKLPILPCAEKLELVLSTALTTAKSLTTDTVSLTTGAASAASSYAA